MRHKYETQGIVLARSSLGEANAFVMLLTSGLGLVRARAQGVRKPGAKLAAALATFAESELVLVRGREGWRVAGAVLAESWSRKMQKLETRAAAARVSGLLLRLVAGEAHDAELYPIMRGFFTALAELPENTHEAVELLAVLRVLAPLGLDAGLPVVNTPLEGQASDSSNSNSLFAHELLATIAEHRTDYISRINNSIAAS